MRPCFFTNYVNNSGWSTLADCTRNGKVTPAELSQLRAGSHSSPPLPPSSSTGSSTGSSLTHLMCTTANGESVEDGVSVKVECNTCTCSRGILSCTEMACTGCIDEDGVPKEEEATWTSNADCPKTMLCRGGKITVTHKASGCKKLHDLSTIGIGVSCILFFLLAVWVVARRRRQLEESNEIVLEETVDHHDESNEVSAFGVQPVATNIQSPYTQSTYGLQTTPMVLMTQTGQPLVVQVAYV